MRNAWQTFAVVALLCGASYGGTINVRSGSADYDDLMLGDGPVLLSGSRQFSFSGFAFLARLDAVDCVFPCAPGETVSLGSEASGNDLPGIASLEGTDYTDMGDMNSWNQLSIRFTGLTQLPAIGRRLERTFTAPVSFEGTFIHATVPLAPEVEELQGNARARLTLKQETDLFGEPAWTITHLTYVIRRR